MYFVILFVPPLYFLIKKKIGAFILSLLLMLIAGMLIMSMIFLPGGIIIWLLAIGHASWHYRKEQVARHAELIATKIIAAQTTTARANAYNERSISGSDTGPSQKRDLQVPAPPPSEIPQEKKAPQQAIRDGRSSIIESAIVKGLISEARQLEADGDKDSLEQSRLLWEEALKIGGLSVSDGLLCHYRLGSYHTAKGNIDEGTEHYQVIALKDPELTFLEMGEAAKSTLISDLFTNLSVGWQSLARNVKGERGTKSAIDYLLAKINILGLMAAPSVLVELGSYYNLYGNRENARAMFERALEAPTYGSDIQEGAKRLAADYLQSLAVGARPEVVLKERLPGIEPAQVLGQPETQNTIESPSNQTDHRGGKSKVLWACVGCVVIGIGVFIAWPREYGRHLKMARSLFQQGNYSGSLELVHQAKEHKTTPDLIALEDSLLRKMREIKEQEEAERLRKEYQDYHKAALESFANGRYDEAKRLVGLAASRMNTRELVSLDNQIETKLREASQFRESARDDNAFASAVYGNTKTSYRDYLRMYPAGKHAGEARVKLSELARVELENQQAERGQRQALELQRRSSLADERRREEEERKAKLASDLQNKINEKIGALREGCIVQVPYNFTQSSKYRGKIGVFMKMQNMGDKYAVTIKEMKGQKYAWEKADSADTLDQIVQAVRKRKQFDVIFSKQDLINMEILALDEKNFKDSR